MSQTPEDLVKMWFSVHCLECDVGSQERGSSITQGLADRVGPLS